jgi:hypothetical protein
MEYGAIRALANVGCHRCLLPVEPDVFHAPAIVLAVDHDGQPVDLRPYAGGGTSVVDDRADAVLLQLLVDVPDEMPALVAVGNLGLLDELFLELGVALRGAAVILEKIWSGSSTPLPVSLRPIW